MSRYFATFSVVALSAVLSFSPPDAFGTHRSDDVGIQGSILDDNELECAGETSTIPFVLPCCSNDFSKRTNSTIL